RMAVMPMGRDDRACFRHVGSERLGQERERRHLQAGAAARIDLLEGDDIRSMAADQLHDRNEIVMSGAIDSPMDIPGQDTDDSGPLAHRRRLLARVSSACKLIESPIQAMTRATSRPISKSVGVARMRAS